MKKYRLLRFEVLSVGSNLSNKSGHLPHQPRYRKHFVNPETGEYSQCTDLDAKKYKRGKVLVAFQKFYEKPYARKDVSILTLVIKEERYHSPSLFLNSFSKKLSRNKIEKLAHIWVRDVDEKTGLKHCHLIIATSRIGKKAFLKLFSKKTNNDYDVVYQKTRVGLRNYLNRKEVFAMKSQRSYGRSKQFKLPIKTD